MEYHVKLCRIEEEIWAIWAQIEFLQLLGIQMNVSLTKYFQAGTFDLPAAITWQSQKHAISQSEWYEAFDSWIYVEFCVQFFQLTQAVDAVRVWTGLILLDKLKTMWWLVDEYTTVVSAAVNDLPQTVPCLSVHLEFNGVHILHLHYLCTVW